jgi:hypothetical protein
VPADACFRSVSPDNHGHSVPPNNTFDPPFDLPVSWERRLFFYGYGIDVRSINRKREGNAGILGLDLKLLENIFCLILCSMSQDIIKGTQPFLNLNFINIRLRIAAIKAIVHTGYPFLVVMIGSVCFLSKNSKYSITEWVGSQAENALQLTPRGCAGQRRAVFINISGKSRG